MSPRTNNPEARSSRSYLSECSDAFIQSADVKFIVGHESYPAHSQLLCCRSDVIHRMLEDCSHYSVEEPLVISEALLQYGADATQIFLKHVYQHHPVSSHKEAQQLLSMAHLLDAPSLMKKAVSYMEDTEHLLQATCEPAGAIYWLLLADRFDLTNFRQQCIHFTVQHFHVLQRDDRLAELRTATSMALLRALQAKIEKHEAICPGEQPVSQHPPSTYWYRGFGPAQPSSDPFGTCCCQKVTVSRPDFRASGPPSTPAFHASGTESGLQNRVRVDMSTPAFGAGGSVPQSTHGFGEIPNNFGAASGWSPNQSTPGFGGVPFGFGATPPQSTPAFGFSVPQSSTFGARM